MNWQDALDVSPATIHNWMAAKPISENNLIKIARAANIAVSDLDLPMSDLCKILSVDIADLVQSTGEPRPVFDKRQLSQHDIDLMQRLAGKYVILYLSREGDPEKEYISVQSVEIGAFDGKRFACPMVQPINVETKKVAEGWLRSTNERILGIISYFEDYYSESIYYGIPFIDRAQPIVYGIYTDITPMPDKEIFSVRFLMVQNSAIKNSTMRIERNDKMFSICRDILADGNDKSHRKRFVIAGDRETAERVKEVARKITMER